MCLVHVLAGYAGSVDHDAGVAGEKRWQEHRGMYCDSEYRVIQYRVIQDSHSRVCLCVPVCVCVSVQLGVSCSVGGVGGVGMPVPFWCSPLAHWVDLSRA